MDKITFVLVHGAWHGGWCWRRVADRLTAKGHRVFTPTLTGLADRSHLLSESVNLSTHVADVVNLIRWEELKDVVLCGHSYGGMVVTGVADKVSERIASLVYLDAFVPESGQSLQELTNRQIPATGMSMPPVSAETFRVNERDRAWVDRQCTPHPLGTVREKLALTGAYRAVQRRHYIRATAYPSAPFDAFYERFKADPGWIVHQVSCGHDVMVDMPDALAEMLEAAL
ncbi:MAG TPA: alpha/beta hydrolase family protein [Stellaceae bacterium]|nr:alpha/beta hydrolase family protein [Stellaceae bacterium]